MMKYKIILATLKGCKSCQALKEKLSFNNINFTEVPCDIDPAMCDELEKLTGSSKYPIVIIKDYAKNLDYVYFTSFDYNILGKEIKIDPKITKIGFFSPEQLIQKINSI